MAKDSNGEMRRKDWWSVAVTLKWKRRGRVESVFTQRRETKGPKEMGKRVSCCVTNTTNHRVPHQNPKQWKDIHSENQEKTVPLKRDKEGKPDHSAMRQARKRLTRGWLLGVSPCKRDQKRVLAGLWDRNWGDPHLPPKRQEGNDT